jgi:transcriptional regulator
MFIPASFRVDDRETLLAFLGRYGFATLVSVYQGELHATHVPLVVDQENGLLLGHLARGNPQWNGFGDTESLAIFMGPHAYVSPTWYTTNPAVPTWNYAAVHVYGVPRLLSPEKTRDVLDLTVRKYESGRQFPWPNDLPDDFRQRLLAGVIGFEMPLTRIEGKYKLGQNRSAADQAGMLHGLHNEGVESRLLAEFIEHTLGNMTRDEQSNAEDSR